MDKHKTWLIVGTSRGLGREFVDQLLARGDKVFATVRGPSIAEANQRWANQIDAGICEILECDMLSEQSINVGNIHSFRTMC